MRRPAHGRIESIALFIHGWTGDERSMEVFSRVAPDTALQIFPRGPVAAPTGYGWAPAEAGAFAPMEAFIPACRALMQALERTLAAEKGIGIPLHVIGFSQGAAVGLVLTLLHPEKVGKLAVLSGFLPAIAGSLSLDSLKGKPVFIAHGTRDDTIPVLYARMAAEQLEAAGAAVDYCEEEAGHKLPAACLRRLIHFTNR